MAFVAIYFWGSVTPVQADGPQFVQGECPFPLTSGNPAGIQIACGTVAVPEFHNDPQGDQITLAVVVLSATGTPPAADPLFMAQGGPGGSTIDTYVNLLLAHPEALADRDIVLFDQRGTLYSSPALQCPEVNQLTLDTLDEDLSTEEYNRRYDSAMENCRQRLMNHGVHLAAYNSVENAADIDWVRQALGYDQINFYGVSYGTLLGFHLMSTHPTWLRSVVLDAVVPPDINFLIESPQTENRSFGLLFSSCQNDPDCNQAYPNLDNEFADLVHRLNRDPIHIQVTDPDTQKTMPALVDGESLVSLFFQMLYSSDLIPAMPRTVYDIKAGRTDFLARIVELIAFDRTVSEGMYYTTMCAEDADFTLAEGEELLQGIRSYIAEGQLDSEADILSICKSWGQIDLNPEIDEPVYSDIPVLLLNGEMDPITPPENGEHAAATLSHATNLVFPGMGHGAFLSNNCPTSITLAFLNDPQETPDSGCIQQMDLPQYYTPQTIVDFPVIMQVLTLKPGGITASLGLVILTGILGLSLLVVFILWLSNRHRIDSALSPRSRSSNLALWLPGAAGILNSIFIVKVVQAAVDLVNNNNTVIFFGLPASERPVFILSCVAVLLLAGSILGCIRAWSRKWWSIGIRVYYTVLALCGAGCIAILAHWGILFPF